MVGKRLGMLIGGAICAAAISACGAGEHATYSDNLGPGYVQVGQLYYQVQVSRELNPWSDEDRFYLQGFTASQLTLPVADEWFGVSLQVYNWTSAAHTPTTQFFITDTLGDRYTPLGNPTPNAYTYMAASIPAGGQLPAIDSDALLRLVAGRVPDLQDPLREPGQPALHPAHRQPGRHREAVADRAGRLGSRLASFSAPPGGAGSDVGGGQALSALGEILWSPPADTGRGEPGRALPGLARAAAAGAPSTATTSCTAGRSRDLEGFWGSLWEFFGVRASTPYERVLGSREMPGAEWFPGARLNYAEHMLGDEDDGGARRRGRALADPRPARADLRATCASRSPRRVPACRASASGRATASSATCRTSPRR